VLRRFHLAGNAYVGVFCATSEDLSVVSPEVGSKAARDIATALGTRVVRTTVAGSTVVGSLVAMNSSGIVASEFADARELGALGAVRSRLLRHPLNAMGNNVLCNDRGALVHPGYDDRSIREMSAALEVPVERGTIAGIRTVGSAAVATNKGVLCHPHIRDAERKVVESVLGVPATITTANYGTAQLGACLIANTKGAVVGSRTTPIELGRIEEGLGYL